MIRDQMYTGLSMRRTDDLRILENRPLIPPAILVEEVPLEPDMAEVVLAGRAEVEACLVGEDDRLVVVVGPCSLHDAAGTLEYVDWHREQSERFSGEMVLLMRAYFEKPRTIVGWKGLINDPDLDGSYRINKGLRLARRLLTEMTRRGVYPATEFLDTAFPQYTADLVCWGAIGARTTESQVHREMASGLSMPVGFKNGTDGNWRSAVEAVLAAKVSHWFPSLTKQGVAAISKTAGNDSCHVILRGGQQTGPNYSSEVVREVSSWLLTNGLHPRVMVDCSHGNSEKDHLRQVEACRAVSAQVESGSRRIFGVMIESNLHEGRQGMVRVEDLKYGVSITDACLSTAQTTPLLEQLAQAVVARRKKGED